MQPSQSTSFGTIPNFQNTAAASPQAAPSDDMWNLPSGMYATGSGARDIFDDVWSFRGSKCVYRSANETHQPRIFSLIVGTSSKARKGTSRGPVEALVSEVNKGMEKPLKVSYGPLSGGEGVIHAFRDEKPAFKQYTDNFHKARISIDSTSCNTALSE